jgi:pimeloyl-ACP methyl ester carboxylesterase/DNA-binding winged helix-turn-helix (wHTH) protein
MHTVMPKTVQFDIYTLDLQCCSLLCGRDEIRLRRKSFDVLRHLAEHAGRVVSKEELIHVIWPDLFVTDDSVVQCIADIRAALHDDAHRIIKTVPRRGYLFAAELSGKQVDEQRPTDGLRGQEITFCRTKDGVNLAMACVGQGMPLVSIPTWLTHLEYDWQSPIRAQLSRFLADSFQLIRYDCRGFGLSDRNIPNVSLATLEADLRTVVDALDLRSYALFGISQGAATAISHAARYPERVSKLVLHAGFALGSNRRSSAQEAELAKALDALLRRGWGDEDSAFLRIFSSVWYPGASTEQIKWYANLLRISTSIENLIRNRNAVAEIDVVDLLPRVSAPTLVLHCRHDNGAPFEEGRRLATSIPKAKFVILDSENHTPLPGEPAWQQFIGEIEAFLSD